MESGSCDLEERLHRRLEGNISLVSDDLLVIGSHVKSGFGGELDLLAVDSEGALVVIELKRDRTPRDVIAQALHYAAWARTLTRRQIERLAETFFDGRSLPDVFAQRFGRPLPEELNTRHRMCIVAAELDDVSEHIMHYLVDEYAADIQVVLLDCDRSHDTIERVSTRGRSVDFFARNPIFTRGEFAESRVRLGGDNDRSVDALLAYHVKQRNLLRIRRGLYAVVPPSSSPESVPIDQYQLTAKLAEDAIVAYHSALQLHGVAYSVFFWFYYLSQHAARTLRFRSLEFHPVLMPKALRDADAVRVGVTSVDWGGVDVRVTTLERTLVDVLDRPELAGGWEEVWRSLEAADAFTIPEVVEYALLLGNRTTIAKVGFFLEQHRSELLVEDVHLETLREKAPRQPHYVEGSRGAPNVLVSGWNIIVPSSVAERSWQDVL